MVNQQDVKIYICCIKGHSIPNQTLSRNIAQTVPDIYGFLSLDKHKQRFLEKLFISMSPYNASVQDLQS